MVSDTLLLVANNDTAQAIAVILQGIFLIIGALTTLIRRK